MENNDLFPSAAPDFGDPLSLLRACHDRILRHCDTLLKLAAHLEEKGVDDEARTAAAQVRRYFSTAGRHHHQDEEEDLFPRIARQSLKLADLVHGLREDHVRMDALWAELEPLLARPEEAAGADRFQPLVREFTDAYRDHIQRENEDLLEMAQHILSGKEIKQLGEQMARRRGLGPKYS